MQLRLTIWTENSELESSWIRQLQRVFQSYPNLRIELSTNRDDLGQLILLDGSMPNVEGIVHKVDRKGRAILLVVDEAVHSHELLKSNQVDDVIVTPFRPLEVLGKLRYYEQILMWNSVNEFNTAISEVIQNLQEDFLLVERLQKAKLPRKFPNVKGMQVNCRYLVGMRSGGDYFDVGDSKDGKSLSILLSDSSSYGLSSAILSTIMRITVKLSTIQPGGKGAVTEFVRKVFDELLLAMKDADHLSLFYGTTSHDQQKLSFVHVGNSAVFYADPGHEFVRIPTQGEAISRSKPPIQFSEKEIALIPQARFVLLSQGFIQVFESESQLNDFLNRWKDKPAIDLLNELTFRVKSNLNDEEMAPRDCTAVVLDVDSRVIKLSTREQDEN
jgi:hypothetical protein